MQAYSAFIPATVHPSLLFAGSLILGISLEHYLYASLGLYSFAAVALLVAGLLAYNYKQKNRLSLLCLMGCLIGALLSLRQTTTMNRAISKHRMVTEAVVKDTILTGNPHWPYRVRLTSTDFSFFTFTKRKPLFNYDDRIELDHLLVKQPQNNDFKKYLHKEGVAGTLFIQNLEGKTLRPSRTSFFGWLEQKKNNILRGVQQKMNPITFAFFSSLFVGDKQRVKKYIEYQKGPFRWWGISHHLARSGLHLMVFVLLWQLIISFIPLPFAVKTSFLTVLSCIYFLLTPASISFVRAFELFLFYKFCSLLDKQINTLHLVCLVCSITLIYNPVQLFFLDFQLSFYLTFCLAWVSQLNRKKRILT